MTLTDQRWICRRCRRNNMPEMSGCYHCGAARSRGRSRLFAVLLLGAVVVLALVVASNRLAAKGASRAQSTPWMPPAGARLVAPGEYELPGGGRMADPTHPRGRRLLQSLIPRGAEPGNFRDAKAPCGDRVHSMMAGGGYSDIRCVKGHHFTRDITGPWIQHFAE